MTKGLTMGRCACGNNLICLSPMEGNQASYDPNNCLYVPPDPAPVFGSVNLPSEFNLIGPSSGVWTDTGITISTPAGGTFEVVSDSFIALHVNVSGNDGTGLVRVYYRIWNNTLGAVVPNTQVMAMAMGSNQAGRHANAGGSTIHTYITSPGPVSLKTQIMRSDDSSGASIATAVPVSGLLVQGTSLRYNKLA